MSQDKDRVNAFRAFFMFALIIMSVVAFAGVLYPPSKKAYNPQKTYSSDEVSADMFAPPPYVDPVTQRETEPTEQQIEQWRSERSDLAAQWETADMAHLAFRMGLLGMLLLGWTIFETRNASNSAYESLRLAEENLKQTEIANNATMRAYLGVSFFDFFLNYQGAGATLTVTGRLQNYGNTPATNIRMQSNIKTMVLPVSEAILDSLVGEGNILTPANPGEVGNVTLNKTLNASDIANLKQGNSTLSIYGRVRFNTLENEQFVCFCGTVIGIDKLLSGGIGVKVDVTYRRTEHSNEAS